MSPKSVRVLYREVRFPRVSGDEPGEVTGLHLRDSFSPRERG